MAISTLSAREFNQHVSRAKRAAQKGPVVITERGRPAFVLLTHEAYEAQTRLSEQKPVPGNLLDALYCPEMEDIDVEFPKMDFEMRAADFD